MPFKDRQHAAGLLVKALEKYRGQNPLVLAIPRGAVPMGKIIADALGGDLDLVLVRKLRAPSQPELAIGSVDEEGNVYLHEYAHSLGIPQSYIDREKNQQLQLLRDRRRLYTQARPALDPKGRVVMVLDDGIATGSTMLAAVKSLRRKEPAKIIAVTAVAPPDTLKKLQKIADEVVCLEAPENFQAVGQFFEDFSQVEDEEVVQLLQKNSEGMDPLVRIPAGPLNLEGELFLPAHAKGLVIFAHGSGSSRHSPRNQRVAKALQQRQIGTLLFDLLTPQEDQTYSTRFNIDLLTERLLQATHWLQQQPQTEGLALGYFGASTGAAAALKAAAALGKKIQAVVSRGGRPDLALEDLPRVTAPTLLIVGGHDPQVLELNQMAYAALRGERKLEVVPGATHLFEEPGTLEEVERLAGDWFEKQLATKQ